jgi:hypothetical protein
MIMTLYGANDRLRMLILPNFEEPQQFLEELLYNSCVERIDDRLAVTARLHQIGVFQNAQVV